MSSDQENAEIKWPSPYYLYLQVNNITLVTTNIWRFDVIHVFINVYENQTDWKLIAYSNPQLDSAVGTHPNTVLTKSKFPPQKGQITFFLLECTNLFFWQCIPLVKISSVGKKLFGAETYFLSEDSFRDSSKSIFCLVSSDIHNFLHSELPILNPNPQLMLKSYHP